MPKTIAEELAEKTFRELAEPEKPTQRSRMSQTSNGYIHSTLLETSGVSPKEAVASRILF